MIFYRIPREKKIKQKEDEEIEIEIEIFILSIKDFTLVVTIIHIDKAL